MRCGSISAISVYCVTSSLIADSKPRAQPITNTATVNGRFVSFSKLLNRAEKTLYIDKKKFRVSKTEQLSVVVQQCVYWVYFMQRLLG